MAIKLSNSNSYKKRAIKSNHLHIHTDCQTPARNKAFAKQCNNSLLSIRPLANTNKKITQQLIFSHLNNLGNMLNTTYIKISVLFSSDIESGSL